MRGNACPGHSAGSGMSLKQRAYASELDWAAKPRMPIASTFDKSPVRERRTPGPVRGARGNSRSYRDRNGLKNLVRSACPLLDLFADYHGLRFRR